MKLTWNGWWRPSRRDRWERLATADSYDGAWQALLARVEHRVGDRAETTVLPAGRTPMGPAPKETRAS